MNDFKFEAIKTIDIEEAAKLIEDAFMRGEKLVEELKQKDELISNLQKMVEDECSRRCKLEKQLEIAKEALEYYAQCKHLNLDILAMLLDKHKKEFTDFEVYEDGEHARQALKEMKGVK